MKPRVRVKFKYKGARPSNLRWSQLKEMVDAVAEAVHQIAPEIDTDEIIPVDIHPGSVAIDFQAPPRTGNALRLLARRADNAAAPKLKALVSRLGAQVYVAGARGQWAEVNFKESERVRQPRLVSTTSYVAYLEDLGGADPRIRLRLPNDEQLIVKASEEDVIKLGAFIYRDIRAKMTIEMEPSTGRVLSRRLVSFEPYEHRPVSRLVLPDKPADGLEFASVADLLASRGAANG